MSILSSQTQTGEVYYPCEDGEPLAETPLHVRAIVLLTQALQDFFRDRPDVYIGTDMYWYWEEGNPNARCAPDVMVIPGIGQKDRRSFFSWEEDGAVPATLFEISSENTWREDLDEKRRLYADLGVGEYFLFDPEDKYLRPSLMGFRLRNGIYELIDIEEGRLKSEELGLLLRAEDQMIRLYDGSTGQAILTREVRADQATKQANEANQRADQATQQANEANQRAKEAIQRAQRSEQIVKDLQSEIERLKALLEQKSKNGANEQ